MLLLSLAFAVILILPSMVQTPVVEPVPTLEPTATPEPAGRSLLLQQKGIAEAELEQLLRRRAELESQGVTVWAGEEYETVLEGVTRADEELEAGHFAQAATGYQAAILRLDQLQQSRADRFQNALASGMLALDQLDANAAQQHFRIAVALRPGDGEAQQGLARSQTLDQVVALTGEAQGQEQLRQWEAAIGYYQQAVELDAHYQPAREGLDRARAAQREEGFRAAMTSLQGALDQRDFSGAQRALDQAGNLKPGAPELEDAAQRLLVEKRRHRLFVLRRGGKEAMAREDWAGAVRHYTEALKLDPGAGFARDGLTNAERRLQLQRRLEHYLQQPERLQAERPLANARSLLDHLQALVDRGPKLQAQTAQLAGLVAAADSRVVVRLHSDGATDVLIYRVGRFGQFRQKELELRPGTYTLVGSREGYRDVRKTLKVQAGAAIDVVIRCEERI